MDKYAKIQPMVQKDARDIALEVYEEKATEYGVAQTPSHTHNGQDSVQFPFVNLQDAPAYAAIQRTVLTASQVQALHTTPIQVVPASGGRSVNIVESIDVRLVYAGTAYTGANALEFRYTDGAGAKVTADISTTFLNASASAYSHVAGVVTELVPVAGAAVVVAVPVANPGTGNSPITIVAKYRVVAYPA